MEAMKMDEMAMDQMSMEPDMMAIPNKEDQHAFVMLGEKTLFLSHLTMFHMENHCYQLVVQASLPGNFMQRYLQERAEHPDETFFLGNSELDLWTVPQLQIGKRTCFLADIWRGIPYKKEYTEWPWRGELPVIPNVPVCVERIVYFRHFDLNQEYPKSLSYLLFGAGEEAFLAHLQVKEPDFDQVATLTKRPEWLPEEQLQAAVPINFPGLPGNLLCTNPLQNKLLEVAYAGFPKKQEPLQIDVKHTDWFCTKIVNSKNPCTEPEAPAV
jgi:hypothetical protein